MKTHVLAVVCVFVSATATVSAQLGPWTDGEIVVEAPAISGPGLALYRIAPESGSGAALVSGFLGAGGWSGRIAFDNYRSRLLVNMSLPPDGAQTIKLWSVNFDGGKTPIAGFDGAVLRALVPIGDGRVYYQHFSTSPSAPNHVHYIDATDGVHTLMDATNTAPFVFPVEHMLYHAPSNSLFASTSRSWTANNCGPSGSSLFKIPLSTDGSHVAGPVACVSVDAPLNCDIMALDYLPNGSVLVTTSTGGTLGGAKLFAVDPTSLAVTLWADPSQFDVNGGCYSARIGKAIILDDATNELRTFVPGQVGGGATLTCNVPIGDASTGQIPRETMWEIDTNGPGCFGTAVPYGIGLAGAAGFVPTLGVTGCPDVGQVFTIAIDAAVGGAAGVLVAGPAPSFIPIAGGFLYVDPITLMIDLVAFGPAGVGGAGSVGLPVFTSDPAVAGFVIFLQAGFIDGAAPQGVSLTNGLALIIG